MARKTTTVVEENAGADDPITTLFESDEETPDELAIEGLISEFTGGDNISVNVYRQGEGANNIAFLFKTTPQEMTGGDIMERVRDKFGSGDYRVHFRDKERIVANRGFSVEAPTVPEAPTPGNSNMEMMTMMQGFLSSQQAMFGQTMQAFAEAFKGGGNNQQTFDPIAAQASLMQQLVALKGLSEPKDDSKSAVDMFVQGISLAKDLNPKDGDTNSSDIVLKALEVFGGPIAEAAKTGTLLAQANRQDVAPGGTQPPNSAQPPTPTGDATADADAQKEYEMGLQKMMLVQQLNWLVKQATANKDPELYAELLLDQVGEEKVLQFVGQENALDQLTALSPEVGNHREWFESLRAAILDLTAPDVPSENEGIEGELIPAEKPDAIPSTNDNGHPGVDTGGTGGDTPNA